jgi:hypothetical protein
MIEVGILKTWDSVNYKAGVQLAGSLTTYFDNLSVARNIPSSAMIIGNFVIVAMPEGNPKDACVIATWPQGSPGGMEVHGNEYHDPDFEGEGVAATLVESHRTTEVHTQPQPSNFLKLSDTPPSYSGEAGKYPKVNAAENALEFSSGGGGGSKIQDADGDTWIDVEKNADEDKIRMGVKDVEAFLLHDDGILTLAKQSSCSFYQTTPQSIPNETTTTLEFQVISYDVQNELNLTTNRFTAKRAGTYLVAAYLVMYNLAVGKRAGIGIWKNGSDIGWGFGALGSGLNTRSGLIRPAQLAAGDYLDFRCWHEHGAACNTVAAIYNTYVAIAKLF